MPSSPRCIPSLPPMSEAQWTRQVIDLAKARRWWMYHPHDSRRSEAGWPDWTFIRPPRIVFAELKTDRKSSKLTAEQEFVIGLLTECVRKNLEVYVWRPKDFDDVREVLW